MWCEIYLRKREEELTVVIVQFLTRVWLCDSMDYSTPGLPVLHHLPEFAQVQCSLKSTPDVKFCHLLYQKLYQLMGELWTVCFKMVNYIYYIDFTSLEKRQKEIKQEKGLVRESFSLLPSVPNWALKD